MKQINAEQPLQQKHPAGSWEQERAWEVVPPTPSDHMRSTGPRAVLPMPHAAQSLAIVDQG